MLREREPGAFVIRDSHSFRGAYGLAMKVASPPPSVHQSKKGKRWWCSGALVDKIYILWIILVQKCKISKVNWFWYLSKVWDGTKYPNVIFKRDFSPLMAINCLWALCYFVNIWLMILPLHFLTLQVTSTMSWWGTSWLRAALKESNWRVVLMSLTLVSRSCLPRMFTIFGRSKRGSCARLCFLSAIWPFQFL